jgi:hypothetical protein
MILTDCKPDTYVRCDRFRGVACIVVKLDTEHKIIEPDWDDMPDGFDADTWWPGFDDIEEVETGMVVIRMVGDDQDHIVDPDDLTPIDSDGICSCGQLGCGWGHA